MYKLGAVLCLATVAMVSVVSKYTRIQLTIYDKNVGDMSKLFSLQKL